jgi:hypothetical protein
MLITNPYYGNNVYNSFACQTGSVTTPWFCSLTVCDYLYHENFQIVHNYQPLLNSYSSSFQLLLGTNSHIVNA